MPEQPPSPPTPASSSSIAGIPPNIDLDERIVLTTSQLSTALEDVLGVGVDEELLEELLLELDRDEYVEWITVTHNGDYVWDLTESPDRVADKVAEIIVESLWNWFDGGE